MPVIIGGITARLLCVSTAATAAKVKHAGRAALGAVSGVTVRGAAQRPGKAILTSRTLVTAAATKLVRRTASLASRSALGGTAKVTHRAIEAEKAVCTFSPFGGLIKHATAALSARAVLTGRALAILGAKGSLRAVSTSRLVAQRLVPGAANLGSAASVTGQIHFVAEARSFLLAATKVLGTAAGPLVRVASANLKASASVQGSGLMALRARASLATASVVVPFGSLLVVTPAVIAGPTRLTARGSVQHAGLILFTVTATESTSAATSHAGQALLGVTSTLTGLGSPVRLGIARLAASSAMQVQGNEAYKAQAHLGATASLGAASQRIRSAQALLRATTALLGQTSVLRPGQATLLCRSTVTNSVQVTHRTTATLRSGSTLIGSAQVNHVVQATLVCRSQIGVDSAVSHAAQASLTCAATMANIQAQRLYTASSAMEAGASMLVTVLSGESSSFGSQVYDLNFWNDWHFPEDFTTPPNPLPSPFVASNILISVMHRIQNAGYECGLSLERRCPAQTWQAAEQYVLVIPGREAAIEGLVTGMGRYGSGEEMWFTVALFQRYAVDQAYTSDAWITRMRAFEIAILDLLQIFFPTESNGALLTFEPIRVRSHSPQIQYNRSKEWGYLQIPWEAQYLRPTLLPDILPTAATGTDVLDAIRNQLLAEQITNVVHYSLDEKPQIVPLAPCWITIKPDNAHAMVAQVTGAGRYVSGFHDRVMIQIYTRSRLDMGFWSTLQLTHTSLGLLTKAQQVYDALQLYMPSDASGRLLVEEGIRMLSQSEPEIWRENREWTVVTMTFDVFYRLGITEVAEVGI